MPNIAMATTFLEAMYKLPKQQKKRVFDFLRKWHADPKAAAINYEKIHNMRDDRVRTVRIDQKYRAVMLHPDDGDTYVLVWVDNHDESMDWARNKQFEINPATGAFQIINVDEVERVVEQAQQELETNSESTQIFECSDEDLILFGLPEVLVPSVRAIRSKSDILKLAGVLTEEVLEALCWLAEGMPHQEIWEAIGGASAGESEAPPTLEESLDNANSRRRVVRIKSIDDFEKVLDAPLEKWRVYLHPSQQKLVRADFAGPALVTGGAGTGKTVVAIHRAKHLLETVFTDESDRILFTTYTANLANNIRSLLRELCGANADRIDVLHLDSWAVRRLRENGTSVKIADQDDINQTWDIVGMEEPCPFDAIFLKGEYDYAVKSMGVSSKSEYFSLKRTGRPHSLDRLQKSNIWELFSMFTRTLESNGLWRWEDVVNRAADLVVDSPYRAVIVDEAQDFIGPSWRLIWKLAAEGENDLFLVGDERQRIYGRPTSLLACGVDVGNRTKTLKINYRTTEQIQSWAFDQLTEPDSTPIAGKPSSTSRSLLSGPNPEIILHNTKEAELATLTELIPKVLDDIQPEEIVITARAKWLLKDFASLLDQLEVPHVLLDKDSDEKHEGIRLATMHRIKGLEFRCVIAASVNEGIIPDTFRGREDDPSAIDNHRRRERALLYVATTRARERAIISTSGKPSILLVD